jgi:hypothetical protein
VLTPVIFATSARVLLPEFRRCFAFISSPVVRCAMVACGPATFVRLPAIIVDSP